MGFYVVQLVFHTVSYSFYRQLLFKWVKISKKYGYDYKDHVRLDFKPEDKNENGEKVLLDSKSLNYSYIRVSVSKALLDTLDITPSSFPSLTSVKTRTGVTDLNDFISRK